MDVSVHKWVSSFSPFQLVTSGVSSYQHTSVTLEFFETVVRYEKFFTVEPQHIPCVLVSVFHSVFDDQIVFCPCSLTFLRVRGLI